MVVLPAGGGGVGALGGSSTTAGAADVNRRETFYTDIMDYFFKELSTSMKDGESIICVQ